MIPEDIEKIATAVVDSAIKVHRSLGVGLLESAYQTCLAHELRKRGYRVECEIPMPINYDGIHIEAGYRIDMLVAKSIIIENKAVEKLLPIHEAQLVTYLRMSGYPIGFLLNWNSKRMIDGLKRKVNNIFSDDGKSASTSKNS